MHTMEIWEFYLEPSKGRQGPFLLQIVEYVVLNQIADEPAFAWWINKVLNKRDRIVSKTTSKYWQKMHKYGLRIPHTVKEAIDIDKENGDTLCWDAILQ